MIGRVGAGRFEARFELPLLYQSLLMIVAQLLLLYRCVLAGPAAPTAVRIRGPFSHKFVVGVSVCVCVFVCVFVLVCLYAVHAPESVSLCLCTDLCHPLTDLRWRDIWSWTMFEDYVVFLFAYSLVLAVLGVAFSRQVPLSPSHTVHVCCSVSVLLCRCVCRCPDDLPVLA